MDLSKAELEWLIDEALYLKHQLDRGERHDELLKKQELRHDLCKPLHSYPRFL